MARTSVVGSEFGWWMKSLLLDPMLLPPGGSVLLDAGPAGSLVVSVCWRRSRRFGVGGMGWDEKGVQKAPSHDPRKKKKTERKVALLRLGIQPLSAGCETPVPTPSPHCSDGRDHRNQDWELSARPWKADCQRVRVHQEPPPTAGNTAWASSECFGASLAIWTCIGWWGGDDVVERKGQRGVTRRWELKLSVVLGSYRDGVTDAGGGYSWGQVVTEDARRAPLDRHDGGPPVVLRQSTALVGDVDAAGRGASSCAPIPCTLSSW